VTVRRARIYDAVALFSAVVVILLDHWTKSLVIEHLGPANLGPQVPLVGQYLVLYYIRNTGAAFNMFETNVPVLIALIAVAVAIIIYLYLKMLNSGSWLYKLVFGLIIGGAVGNLIDRFIYGSVVDFIWFRIPEVSFSFAVFNLADSAITTGVILLLATLLFGGLRAEKPLPQHQDATDTPLSAEILPTPSENDA